MTNNRKPSVTIGALLAEAEKAYDARNCGHNEHQQCCAECIREQVNNGIRALNAEQDALRRAMR